jgi:hypothetical protein
MKTWSAVIAVLLSLLAATCFAMDGGTGIVSGKLLSTDGKSMGGGLVFLFNATMGPPPAPEKYWRVPDEVVPMAADGSFTAELAPGTYYLGAIKRATDEGEIGPPREGDLFFTSLEKDGSVRKYFVGIGSDIKMGTVREAAPFKAPAIKAGPGITAIEGTIVDEAGKPVTGALVFAFLSPNMVGKPLFVSEKTGADGAFLLRVGGGGSYFLKARDIYGGGAPNVGALIGTYGEKAPVAVETKAGTSTGGIVIKVGRFTGRGPGASTSGPPR